TPFTLSQNRETPRDNRSLHHGCVAADARRRTPLRDRADRRPPAARVSSQLPGAGRHSRRRSGIRDLGAERVLRVPEVCEAVGVTEQPCKGQRAWAWCLAPWHFVLCTECFPCTSIPPARGAAAR